MGQADRGSKGNFLWLVPLLMGGLIAVAAGSEGVSAKFSGDSWVACLISLKQPSSYAARKEMAEADTHAIMSEGPYRGTAKQNRHMVRHSCPSARVSKSWYGRKRPSRESYAVAKSPNISASLYHEIRQAARDTARNHGLDEEKFLQTIGCESGGFYPKARNANRNRIRGRWVRTVDRGIAQINDYYHPRVSDAQAYDWRFSLGYAARVMKVDTRLKDGTPYSNAAQWYCYKLPEFLNYGVASMKAQPTSRVVASTSD